jgi:uncharacterized membrane protein affecting hemolysin expression
MENNKLVGVLLVAFVAVILGIAFLTSIANDTTRVTQANTITNESITWASNGATVGLANNQLDSITSIKNSTGGSILTQGTNYTVNLDTGQLTSVNRNGTFLVIYAYRQVGNAAARNVLNVVLPMLFAIGVLLALLWALSPSFRDLVKDL